MNGVLDMYCLCTSPASYTVVIKFFNVVFCIFAGTIQHSLFIIALLQKLCAARGSKPKYSFQEDEDSGTVVCKVSCKQHCYL